MSRTTSLLVVAALTFMLILPRAVSLSAPQTAIATLAGIANNIDPNAVKQLKQVNETYKAIQSFTAEFEEGVVGSNDVITFSRHSRVAFRRPDQLMLITDSKSGPTHVVSDGRHVSVTYPWTPHQYTMLPCILSSNNMGSMVSLQGWEGVPWLYNLVPDEGSFSNFSNMELSTVSTLRKQLANGSAVDEVTCHWTSTRGDPNDWMVRVYTVECNDHLLYQYSSQAWYDPKVHVVRYTRININPALQDAMFAPKHRDKRLPLAYITSITNDSVTLDKGSDDRITSGDELLVFTDETLRSCGGEVLVTQTGPHESTAAVMWNTGGLRPGNVCVIVKHRSR